MALSPGTRLGAYEVMAQIGEGGMGQVYRARDTALHRDVALKVLHHSMAGDPDGLARFTREARTLASLNHPNIGQIHGVEESDGVRALVMELVEGEDLSQRIMRGALPLKEALSIGTQIAEALEAAHEQAIIHRDLKPANIKVRPDGTVKVLDFGLAKALVSASASTRDSASITSPALTMSGTILGTWAYMAPEQATGKPLDRRADIWAFGAVMYEMLTGQRAFRGQDSTETIAAVLSEEPDWSALPDDTPDSIRRLLHRCLRKDRKQRLADAADARLEIDDAVIAPPALDVRAIEPVRNARSGLWWTVGGVSLLAILAALVAWRPWNRLPEPLETRVEIVTPPTDQHTSFALSPDGRRMVFVGSAADGSRLWLRSLATTTAQPLSGTEGAAHPFWSPDGRAVGFFSGNTLKRIDLGGGSPQTLAKAINGSGGAWSSDGFILFSPSLTSPLMRVSDIGGAAEPVTKLETQQVGHLWPHLLPADHQFLFYVFGAPETGGIYLGAPDRQPTRLTAADGAGAYLPSGWLLWVRAGTLVAQRLDLTRRALTGEPILVADRIAVDANSSASALSVATTGVVAYRTSGGVQRRLTWINRDGTAQGVVGDADASDRQNPRISSDGLVVAESRVADGNVDIWLIEGDRSSRATFDAAVDYVPVWSPDGTQMVFGSDRTGLGDLYQKLTNGTRRENRIVASDQITSPSSWSADGRFLLYLSTDPKTSGDLWVLPMVGEQTPAVFLKTPFREVWGAFSPDGQWVAYQSNESGRNEIYVRAFVPPGTGGTASTAAAESHWQVSRAGGIHPVWRSDGRELYFLNPSGVMTAATVTLDRGALTFGEPAVLFQTRIYGGGVDVQQGRQYDVAADGRFLVNTMVDEATPPITLLMNWTPDRHK